jgi:hypothetical protein
MTRSPKPAAPDYSRIDPAASVYAGRDLLGYLVDGDRQCIALTVSRQYLGTFPDRKSAILAILMRPTGRTT